MKLYNPTPEMINGGFDGRRYYIDPGHFIDVNQMTGEHLLKRESFKGLVDITLKKLLKKDQLQKFIVEKSAEGLEKYIEKCHGVVESFIQLDIEMKQNNQFGTALKDKSLKLVTHNLEVATRMLKDIETKYGVSIKKADIDEKTGNLMASIDSIIKEFDADSEKQDKATKQEKEMNELVSKMIPEQIKNFDIRPSI